MGLVREIRRIILHCTDGEWGNVESIRRFHMTERGWGDIGYHFLITNCYPTFEDLHSGRPDISQDGKIHPGRPIETIGAHAKGWNSDSIGIALVGRRGSFTGLQIRQALSTCRDLAHQFEVPFSSVIGHYETGANKTCPDINMDFFRELLRQ